MENIQIIKPNLYLKMISNEIVTLINALGLDPKVEEIDIKRSKVWKNNNYDRC